MYDQELENLLSEFNARLNEIYQLDPGWKLRGGWKQNEMGSIAFPPASNKDIARLENRLGKAIPPSYARFLRLHDGWKHFWEDFTLIGTKGEHTEEALMKIQETKAWQLGFVKEELGEITPSGITRWEAEWEGNLYLENHLVFSTNLAGTLYLFDVRTTQADGEMTIRRWPFSGDASVDRSYQDFDELVCAQFETANKFLTRLRRSKGKKSKL